ncbi:MAG TPA: hypothetical protein VF883_10505 [Thermoanaerobaculia bacterium]|jgi:hypothetical protein
MKHILLLLVAIACVACRYEAPPAQAARPQLGQRTVWQRTDLTGKRIAGKFVLQPKVLSRCEAGSQLGADQLVARPASAFRQGESVYLTMWLAEAPEGLQVALRVVDDEGNEVGTARRDDAGGLRAVTMQVGDALEPGRYTLEGFWGANLVCEKLISVVAGVGGTAEGR